MDEESKYPWQSANSLIRSLKDEDMYDKPERVPREQDTMQDDEGTWFFEDGQWWLE